MELLAGHAEDARKHPNIKRLLEVIATGKGYMVSWLRTGPNPYG
ncbi:hypothetical protein [Alicycliphilus denitrificans]